MTDPVSGGKGPSEAEELELVIEGSYNPLLASVMSGGLTTSTAETQQESSQSAIPRITAPLTENLYQKVVTDQSEIVSRMAQRWSEEIEIQKELRAEHVKKEEKIEKAIRKQREESVSHEAWHNALAAVLGLYGDPSNHPAAASGQVGKIELSSAVASSIIIGAGLIGGFEPGNKTPSTADHLVVQEMWARVAVGHKPADMVTQAAGWVSALWGVGVSYFSAVEQMSDFEGLTRSPMKDLDFAVNYAQNLLKALNTPDFSNQIRVVVLANLPGTEAINSKDIEKLSRMGKIILLTLALALIMKLELGTSFKEKVYEGHITGEEVLGMLSGELDFQTQDPHGLALVKARLVVQINMLLGQLPQAAKEELLGNLKAYLSTNPPLENLTNANHAVRKIFGANRLGASHLEQNPV